MKLTFVLLLLFCSVGSAKRGPIPKVNPLVKDGVEYFYVVEPLTAGCPAKVKSCGEKVSMTATLQKSKIVVWKTELYQNKYDLKLETDVQSIFPRSMAFIKRERVELIDETGRHFFIYMKNGKMDWPAGSRKYRGKK